METKRRVFGWQRCWWAMALAAVLVCIPMVGTASAAPATGAVIMPDEPAPKPTVSIVGNVVVDKNKPTGFYELSLRVKTPRIITLKDDPSITVDEDVYIEALENDAKNGTNIAATTYNVKNYPFESVAAAVYIDLDALSPVTWGTGKPIYDTWEASASTPTLGHYKTVDTGYEDGHPRGINLEEKDQPNIFTDLSGVVSGKAASVRLDTAHPDEITNATALIEKVSDTSALLTLTANTTTTNNVIYDTETPVVVVRFAYDLNRFKNTDVSGEKPTDFWVGLDKSDDTSGPRSGQFPLTYLAEGKDNDGGYGAADGKAAASSSQQTVWYAQNLRDDNAGQTSTHFYYYLGADGLVDQGTRSYLVVDSDTNTVPNLDLITPKTVGRAALARKDTNYGTAGDPETEKYSFFQNLLQMGKTLILRIENAETYRKPTGSGGATVLFYDWDDSLIGSLVVDPVGDVRAAVNEYVERVMIHENLRTSDNIAAAADLETLKTDQVYLDRVNSLAREHTYRGEYAYEVGPDKDNDASLKRENGGNFPLTNKLDYAFYRHVTTQTEVKNEETGVTTRYFSTKPVSGVDGEEEEEYDGYLYPYIYGWAIVEDEDQDIDKDNWILHKDAVKTEDVWTTFGVGELGSLDPSGGVTGSFVDPADGVAKPYTYAVTDQDAGWYFKLADFTAMENMLREGQDVLIVKAVYEPGTSLLKDDHYTVINGSLHVERYSYAASTEESVYSFQYQYRRANDVYGSWRGAKRTRLPAVQTGFTYDVNAFEKDPTRDTKAFYMKTISDNVDIMDIDITAGGILWKIDYVLVDTYGYNIATGVKRSAGGELDLKSNFLYEEDIKYSDRQGTDGFVLEATLNTLLAEATKGARGESNTLLDHFTEATIGDLNFKADINGGEFNILNYDLCSMYVQDLVTRLYNAGVSIDPKTGDVTLGWHQIQRHILLCMQAGRAVDGIFNGSTLMSETDCEGFTWCRLDDCGLTISVDIFDLGDIFVALDKAKSETGDKHPAKDALDKLMNDTPSLLDGYLNQFRKDEDGRKFKNRTEMMNALKDVYNILSAAGLDQDAMKAITPAQVQEIIITGKYPTTGKTYWWWNNGKRPIATWKDFIEAGMLVATGDVPDALDAMTDADLPNVVQNMISYAAPTGSPANVGWFRYKDSQEEDNEYASVAAFKADWIAALNVLRTKYTLPRDWDTIPWEEIQYALIHKSYKDVTSILRTEDYWWRDGGLPKLTYEKLLAAANAYRKSNYTDSSELDRLLAKGINPVNNEVYLRRTAAGSGFTTVATFKTALRNALTIIDYTSNAGTFVNSVTGDVAIDVYQMQYLLLNASKLVGKELPSSADIQSTAGYWWIPEPHLPTSAQRVNDIMDLLTYAYWQRDGVGGTPLTFDALGMLDAATMERLGLRPEAHGMPYTDETNAALIAQVLAVLNKLPYTIDNFSNQSAANLTREVQYVLLHGTYLPAASITENYWWQGSGFVAETHEALARAAWLANVGFGGKTAPDAMNGITDLDFITQRAFVGSPGMAMRSNMSGAAFISIDAFKTTLSNAIKAAASSGITYSDLTGMTDYQLQYLLLNGVYKSDAAVKAEVIVDGVDAYWWFTADKPPEPEVNKEPIEIDAAEWDAFLDSAIGYFKKSAGNPDGFVYDLTDEKLKDVLRLRQGPNDTDTITKEEMFDGSKTDLLWRVMTALNNSNRKSDFITGTATNRKWKNKPTWAEFQYVLLHLDGAVSGWTMPPTEECEAAKDGYGWMWTVSGAVEYEPVRPEATEWDSFLDSAIGYFKKSAGNPSGFVYDLTDDKLDSVLLLRKENGDPITKEEMFDGSKTDLLWRVMTALNNSNRKSDFITGTATNRKWKNKPTWAEFQYVLLHLDGAVSGWTMLTTEECEAWATQENAPWAWQEKAAGASLLAIDLPEEETLEEEQIPLIWSPPDEIPPDKTSPERADKDSPGAWPPTADAIQEVPAGDEVFVVTLIKRDYQGGYAA